MTPSLTILLAVLLALALRSDLLHNRLPNALTVSAVVAAFGLHAFHGGASALLNSAFGAVVGLGMLLPFYVLRGMAAGDVKLMAAVGSVLGPAATVIAVAVTLIAGAAIAIALVVLTILRRAGVAELALRAVQVGGEDARASSVLKRRFPYAIAIVCGALVATLVKGLGIGGS